MEDKQLERLYDYTKFHIGIYLSAAGGLVALIAMAAKADEGALLLKLIGWRWALLASLLCVVVAGVAGAIVATSTIESTRYTDFLRNKQGAYGLRPFIGKTWVTIEHGAFWLSLVFLGVVVFSADSVPSWLFYRTTLEQSLVTGL